MERPIYQNLIIESFENHPIVAILGPRQCGKTTLAHMYAKSLKSPVHIFDLEDPADLEKLNTPKLTLDDLTGLVIIDEIQCKPNLFPYLRVLADRKNNQTTFLILGSASRDLIRQSSETLAGRIAYIELSPFSYQEVDNIPTLWLRGGFPKSYLAKTDTSSATWRRHYIQTFLERDIPNLGINIPPITLRRFWMMLAHYHGNIFNASEIARSLSISVPTVQKYLDILTGVFMIRQLHPWYVNIKKRQVKAVKIYFRDSGLFHSLIGTLSLAELKNHPKLGASWEGLAIEEIIRAHQATSEECFFWATHGGAELDLLIIKNGKTEGFEIKYTDVPKATPSMHTAMESLKLDQLNIIFPGTDKFPVTEQITAIGLQNYLENLK